MTDSIPPRSLILTALGSYARELDGWLSIATLIDLMGDLGTDEQSVRSAISRLKNRGIVVPERRHGAAGYALSEVGSHLLTQGDARIFSRPREALAEEGWVVAIFSVKESERATRHVLRSQLSWLGFGNMSGGVWLAPGALMEEARDLLVRLGVQGYVHLFRAHYEAFDSTASLVAETWDLDELAQDYTEFIAFDAPILERWRSGAGDDVQAFIDQITVLTHWRPLPFRDPGLPREALPSDWPGIQAWKDFDELIGYVRAPARRHVNAVLGLAAGDDSKQPLESS